MVFYLLKGWWGIEAQAHGSCTVFMVVLVSTFYVSIFFSGGMLNPGNACHHCSKVEWALANKLKRFIRVFFK